MSWSDHAAMARALQLARRGLYSTHPNPRVGCVLVRDGAVVGEGWHVRAGEPHAEVHALRAAGELARGATAYVTLEPCSHHGRTGPCADALLAAGVSRVVAAMQDPNPQVAGQGLARLRAAGVQVESGLLEAEARELNPGFISRMERGRPFVRAKLGMSLDGRTAMASGESQWITGTQARQAVQRLRAQSSLIISGADTVLADQARLTVRGAELGLDAEQTELALSRPPQRLLIDSRLRVPVNAPFYQAGPAWLACKAGSDASAYRAAGHTVLECTDNRPHIDLHALLAQLAALQINEVLVEAGPRLVGAFAAAGLVDEFWLFQAPVLLGSSARPLLDWPLERLADGPRLTVIERRMVGNDQLLIARPSKE